MLRRIKALLSIPPIVATTLGLSYALWLSRAAQEVLPDPSHLPITCEPPSGGSSVILSAVESERVYRSRCDLPDTAAVAEWAPTQEVVADLEPLLPEFLASQNSNWKPKPFEAYVRQYAGFIANGRQEICVNLVSKRNLEMDAYFHRHTPVARAQLPKGVCPEDLWRHQAVGIDVADGGNDYCGVTFDVATRQLRDLNCNGL